MFLLSFFNIEHPRLTIQNLHTILSKGFATSISVDDDVACKRTTNLETVLKSTLPLNSSGLAWIPFIKFIRPLPFTETAIFSLMQFLDILFFSFLYSTAMAQMCTQLELYTYPHCVNCTNPVILLKTTITFSGFSAFME